MTGLKIMINLTPAESIRELNYRLQSANDYDSAALLTNIAIALDNLQDEAEEAKDALFSIINEKINNIIESQIDYEENHKDSHNNYWDMLGDDYAYNNRQKELVDFCENQEIDLTNVDIEALENYLIDNAKSGAVCGYSNQSYHDKFVLGCFRFGELEIQIDYSDIGDFFNEKMAQHMRDNNLFENYYGSPYDDYALFYHSSDNVLKFFVTTDDIKQAIELIA